ncbi:MAG: hypothetical protein ABJC24_00475 [Chloroflexota bacterium]
MNSIRSWVRIALSPPILRRSLLTCAVVGVILTLANHGAEVMGGRLGPDHVWPIAFTFIIPFTVATISSAASIRRSSSGETTPPESEIDAADTFPDANPNPVFRLGSSDLILYANRASSLLFEALGTRRGQPVSADLARRLRAAASASTVLLEVAGRTYSLQAVAIEELGFINVYGTEASQREAIQTSAAQRDRSEFPRTQESR